MGFQWLFARAAAKVRSRAHTYKDIPKPSASRSNEMDIVHFFRIWFELDAHAFIFLQCSYCVCYLCSAGCSFYSKRLPNKQTNNNKRATKESTTTGIQVPSTEFEKEWRAHTNTVTIMLVLVVAPCIKRRKRMWSMKHLLPNNYSSTEI